VMTKPYLMKDVVRVRIVHDSAQYGKTDIKSPASFRLIENGARVGLADREGRACAP
jgi:hypothetical protein